MVPQGYRKRIVWVSIYYRVSFEIQIQRYAYNICKYNYKTGELSKLVLENDKNLNINAKISINSIKI